MTINVGDKVSFTIRRSYRPYLHTVTGTVVDLLPWMPCALALVEPDSGLMPRLVPVDALRVVEAAQDEYADMLAVHPAPFRLIAEDYESAMMLAEAGNIGDCEP